MDVLSGERIGQFKTSKFNIRAVQLRFSWKMHPDQLQCSNEVELHISLLSHLHGALLGSTLRRLVKIAQQFHERGQEARIQLWAQERRKEKHKFGVRSRNRVSRHCFLWKKNLTALHFHFKLNSIMLSLKHHGEKNCLWETIRHKDSLRAIIIGFPLLSKHVLHTFYDCMQKE